MSAAASSSVSAPALAAGYRAVVLGSTGATGKATVAALANSPNCSQVTALVRKSVPITDFTGVKPEFQSKVTVAVVDYTPPPPGTPTSTTPSSLATALAGADAAFCCLGTTRSKAGSAAAFRAIDYDLIVHSATVARSIPSIRHFSLQSSVGADPSASVTYTAVKGQAEAAIGKLDFPRYSIYRPGVLLTERGEKRTGEKIAQWLLPKLHGVLPYKWHAVGVEKVAEVMVKVGESDGEKYEMFENDKIVRYGVVQEKCCDHGKGGKTDQSEKKTDSK